MKTGTKKRSVKIKAEKKANRRKRYETQIARQGQSGREGIVDQMRRGVRRRKAVRITNLDFSR